MPPRPLTTLIVDDEELARRGLRSRLDRIPRVQIIGECSSGREAIQSIRSLSPDLVLLDIQMPGLDGFDVIETIGASSMPSVIFVTAYDEHALRAFKVHALDYLLKPIDNDRLVAAIKRCRERVGTDRADLTERLAALLKEAEASEDHRFVIKSGGRIRFVRAEAIDWVEAAGDYVRLHSRGTVHLLRETMAEMAEQLPNHFLRIHRSTIVNTRRIEELRPYGNSEFIVIMEDGTERKLSRSYRDDLTDFFNGAI